MKKHGTTILLILIFVTGVCLLLYHIVAMPMFLILLIYVMIKYRKKK